MSKVVIKSFEDFQQYVGQELGVSDYVELDQERINLFADATLDHQWIHVDAEKAKQWIANGAQPTDTVKAILKKEGVL